MRRDTQQTRLRGNRLALLAAAAAAALVGRRLWRRRRAADLSGQVALITGGSRGLGLALAEEFARHGARLAICARNPDELEAARRSQPELIISTQAQVAARFQGLFPGLTQHILALIDRALPAGNSAIEEREAWRGIDCETPLTRSPLLALGHAAAREYNELLPAHEERQIFTDVSPSLGGAPIPGR